MRRVYWRAAARLALACVVLMVLVGLVAFDPNESERGLLVVGGRRRQQQPPLPPEEEGEGDRRRYSSVRSHGNGNDNNDPHQHEHDHEHDHDDDRPGANRTNGYSSSNSNSSNNSHSNSKSNNSKSNSNSKSGGGDVVLEVKDRGYSHEEDNDDNNSNNKNNSSNNNNNEEGRRDSDATLAPADASEAMRMLPLSTLRLSDLLLLDDDDDDDLNADAKDNNHNDDDTVHAKGKGGNNNSSNNNDDDAVHAKGKGGNNNSSNSNRSSSSSRSRNSDSDSGDDNSNGRIKITTPRDEALWELRVLYEAFDFDDLSEAMARFNARPDFLLNNDTFGEKLLGEDFVTIAVMTHARDSYFAHVIDSLRAVKGISSALLIVSHDGYFQPMVDLVQTIDFCLVRELFFPLSPHIIQNRHPGTSPNDCPRNPPVSLRGNCTGDADQYGHYREAKFVALKHHWWWLLHTTRALPELREYLGYVVTIEEDHYLSPHALEVFHMLAGMVAAGQCSQCYFINLSQSVKAASSKATSKTSSGLDFECGTVHNMAYAMNRTGYEAVRAHGQTFCEYDDYNWDSSLMHTMFPHLYSLQPKQPFALHIGACGTHVKKKNCSARESIDNFMAGQQRVRLQPGAASKVAQTPVKHKQSFKGWGGWADKRDINLCKSFTGHHDDLTSQSQNTTSQAGR